MRRCRSFYKNRKKGFSLIEVVLCLAVVATCLLGIIGLITVGVSLDQVGTQHTSANDLISAITSDIQTLPPGTTTTKRFNINTAASSVQTLYFDANENQIASSSGAAYCAYVTVTAPASNTIGTTTIPISVCWPALATGINQHMNQVTLYVDNNN